MFVAASGTEATAKAWVQDKTEKEKDAQLEHDLEKLIDDFDELQSAHQRAQEAESKATAMRHLFEALLQMPAEQHTARADMIKNMLRRPATCDIEAMTKQLQQAIATSAPPASSVPDTTATTAAGVPPAGETNVAMSQAPMQTPDATASSAASAHLVLVKPEPTSATTAAGVEATDKKPQTTETPKSTPEPTWATAAAGVAATGEPQTTETPKPAETPEPTSAAAGVAATDKKPQTTETPKPAETPEPTSATAAAGVAATDKEAADNRDTEAYSRADVSIRSSRFHPHQAGARHRDGQSATKARPDTGDRGGKEGPRSP